MSATDKRTRRTARERKSQILETSSTVFTASNYSRAGTAELAKAAGISEAALYRYFPSKKALYISVLQATSARLLGVWRRIAGEAAEPRDAIWTLGMGYYDHLQTRTPVLRLFYQALAEASDPDIRAAVRQGFADQVDFIQAVLEEGRARELVRQDIDSRVAAWHFMCIGLAFDLIHLLDMDEELDRGKVEDWGRLYLESVGTGPYRGPGHGG